MTPVKRIVVSFWLGFLSPFVFVIGAEPFDKPGPSPMSAILTGCILVAVYLAAGQFWLVRKAGQGFRAMWPIWIATELPLIGCVLLSAAVETRSTVLSQGIPMLVSGSLGSIAGAVVGARRAAMSRT